MSMSSGNSASRIDTALLARAQIDIEFIFNFNAPSDTPQTSYRRDAEVTTYQCLLSYYPLALQSFASPGVLARFGANLVQKKLGSSKIFFHSI